MNQTNNRQGVRAKISEDIAVWSTLWKIRVGLPLLCRILLLEPGFQVALSIRLQEALTRVPVVGKTLRRVLWYFTTVWHGCDIAPGTSIGGGIFLPHPNGIVIGGDCVIGRNVQILQGVTLGILAATRGLGIPDKQSPVIEDGVSIFAGARLIGGIRVGAGASIGANSVVLTDVPAGCTAVGVPARILQPRSTAARTGAPAAAAEATHVEMQNVLE